MFDTHSHRQLIAAAIATILLSATPLVHAAGDDADKTEKAVEKVIEKEKQRNDKGDDKNDVGETEFSAQDCSELNKKKEAGDKVNQKNLDECETDSAK